MTTPFSIEADVLQCGYAVGYFDERVIVNWADSQIMATENPCAELLALSTILLNKTNPIDVMNLLLVFSPTDHAKIIEMRIGFIGILLAKMSTTHRQAIDELFALKDEPGVTDEQQSYIYSLDDGYDLAIQGTYGTMQDVERDLQEFVMPYAERLAEQYPHLISPPEHE